MDKNTEYIKDKFSLYTDRFIDLLPSILISIFVLVIFYTIAEYYRIQIIPKKKNLINAEQKIQFEKELSANEETEQEYNDLIDDLTEDLIYYQLSWIVYYSIIIFGILVALVNLGFNIATIVTLLGSIGLALGLALQQTISNIIAGINISINKLFKLGDDISLKPLLNVNPVHGKIIDFNLYYTTIIDKSSNMISQIPNSIIQNNILTNLTLSDKIFNS